MKPLYELVREYLAEDEVKYYVLPCDGPVLGTNTVMAAFDAETCYVWICIDTQDRLMRVSSSCGLKVCGSDASAARDYIIGINHRLLLGHLDIDPVDGELQYIAGAAFDDMEMSLTVFRRMIACAIQVFTESFPVLAKVLHGNSQPVERPLWHRRPPTAVIDETFEKLMAYCNQADSGSNPKSGQAEQETIKRKRGRPRKRPLPE